MLFLSPPVLMHGGLLWITFRLSGVRYWTKIHWIIIHISQSIVARVMKRHKGQGQRSQARVK